MVQIRVHVRPKNGYTYPGKIKSITVDSSTRLEQIVATLKLDTKKGISLYSKQGRHELALNTSLASNNIQSGDILETCACPAIAAVLSLVLRDLDTIQAIPETERTQHRLEPLLKCTIDPWQPDRWDNESIKSRIICMATMKSLIQKQDRFADIVVPPCSTLADLYTFLQTTAVFSESSSRHVRRNNRHSSMAHLFKPSTNRDGKPSTVWQLLQHKLHRLMQQSTTAATAASTGGNLCPIETFLMQESPSTPSSRSSTRRRKAPPSSSSSSVAPSSSTQTGRKRRRLFTTTVPSPASTRWQDQEWNCSTCSSSSTTAPTKATCMCLVETCPFVQQLSCTVCFSSNHPMTTVRGTHVRTALTEPAVQAILKSRHRQNKQDLYCPQYASGPFAILCTLFTQVQDHGQHSLSESRLKELSQRICRSNLYDHQALGRNAFACMEGLMEKNLVRMERLPSRSNNDDEGIYSLLPDGEELARYCYLFQQRVDAVLPPLSRDYHHNIPPRHLNPITLIVDTREDPAYAQRLIRRCHVEQVPCEHRELPAGDYLFLAEENVVCPIVVERKTWSDLADSVLGKGRQLRRLDCVAIGTNSNQRPKQCENGRCQLCKMKNSGCTKVMFLIEGARCLNSEDNPNLCTAERRCQYCCEIEQRHGHQIVQESLEEVLLKLQVEHGCFVHYTRSYNESIDVLLTIRDILGKELSPSAVRGRRSSSSHGNSLGLTYEEFCTKARRKGTGTNDKYIRPSAVVEWDDASFVADICCGNVQTSVERLVQRQEPSSVVNLRESYETSSHSRSSSLAARAASESNDIIVLDGLTGKGRGKSPPRPFSTDEVVVLDDDDDNGDKDNDRSNARKLPSTATPNSEVVILDSDDESSDCSVHVVTTSLPSTVNEVEVINRASNKQSTAQEKLILITGLHQYDTEFYKDLSTLWKNVYQNHKASPSTDFAACCQAQLTPNQHDEVPLVRREEILFWLVQLQMNNFHLEVVRDKTKFGEQLWSLFRLGKPHVAAGAESPSRRVHSEARRRLVSASPLPEPDCIVLTSPARNQASTAPGVATARKHAAVTSEYSKPPRHTSVRKMDPRREHERLARLARFDNRKPAPTANTPDGPRKTLPDDEGWSCSQCTMNNSTQHEKCEACGAPKLGEWKCKICTLVNPTTSSVCILCDTPFANNAAARSYPPSSPLGYYPTTPTHPSVAAARGVAPSGQQPSSSSESKRKVKCGACGAIGHNRASATPSNCDQYYAPAEADRRNKIREKKEKEVREAQQSILNHQRQQTSVASQLEETRRALALLEQAAASDDALRTNEIKRLEKQKKRAQKQAQKYS